ncbi:MAG TPA: glycosyltransferase family 4 protein [Pirellulales bacterium]|nr:glycosyltransferase family 4 protein [Pirellulales bacterium]
MKRTSRWSLRVARKVLTNSSFTLRNVRRRLERVDGEPCPLGLSPDFALNCTVPDPPAEPIELEAVDGRVRRLAGQVLLLVARLDPAEGEKGHAELITTLPDLISEFPSVQLVFPGPGEGRKPLAELAHRLGVADAVFMPGGVAPELLQKLYNVCYAFVMPSRQEGFGLVYLEAMNYAKPCVGCFDDGAEEVIVPGETGWLVRNPTHGAELLEILKSLLSNPERARACGLNGFRRLHERFTSQQHQDRVIASLERIL